MTGRLLIVKRFFPAPVVLPWAAAKWRRGALAARQFRRAGHEVADTGEVSTDEALLRRFYNFSAPYVFRITSHETEVAGVRIGKHEKGLLLLASANHDERAGGKVPISSTPPPRRRSYRFGTEIHGCVGRMVAGLEGDAELSALTNIVGSTEIVGDAVYRDSSGLPAPSTLLAHVARNKINPLESATGRSCEGFRMPAP